MIIKKLCRLMKCSTRLSPPNLSSSIVEAKVLSNNKDCKFTSIEPIDNIEPLSSPEMQLQVIIKQLELQNRELHHMVILSRSNDKEMRQYLEDHRVHVAAQINKLKILKEYLQTAQPTIIKQVQTLKRMESTPLITTAKKTQRGIALDGVFSPITQITECSSDTEQPLQSIGWRVSQNDGNFTADSNSLPSYSLRDISTWIGGCPTTSNMDMFQETDSIDGSVNTKTLRSPVCEMHNDLDEVLAKLQQILANNFILDESLGTSDNGQLKTAVTEVEGMLTSLIDGVENNRANSVHQDANLDNEEETIVY